MAAHRWSGWPGAWCLDCGVEDVTEVCVASHDHGPPYDDQGISKNICGNGQCQEPGSRGHDHCLKVKS